MPFIAYMIDLSTSKITQVVVLNSLEDPPATGYAFTPVPIQSLDDGTFAPLHLDPETSFWDAENNCFVDENGVKIEPTLFPVSNTATNTDNVIVDPSNSNVTTDNVIVDPSNSNVTTDSIGILVGPDTVSPDLELAIPRLINYDLTNITIGTE